MSVMSDEILRKFTLERLSSLEQLDRLVTVTNPKALNRLNHGWRHFRRRRRLKH
jgi:hypothetical protein